MEETPYLDTEAPRPRVLGLVCLRRLLTSRRCRHHPLMPRVLPSLWPSTISGWWGKRGEREGGVGEGRARVVRREASAGVGRYVGSLPIPAAAEEREEGEGEKKRSGEENP